MSETNILSAVHGIAPRSDELHLLGTDLERGRVSQEVFDQQLSKETEDWLQLQSDAGIDFIEDGKLRWQDHLRPIVQASTGFEPGIEDAPVTRWLHNNTFYRQPTITGRLQFDPDRFQEIVGEVGENISIITPGTFAGACKNNFSELSAERNVFQLYSEAIFWLGQAGVKRITLEDYSPYSEKALEDTQTLADWEQDIQFGLLNHHNGFIIVPYSPKSNLGVDINKKTLHQIVEQPDYRRPDFQHGEVWCRVTPGDHTLEDNSLESFETVERIIDTLKPATLVLTHTVDLELLPLPYAQAKVRLLGEYAADLREETETKK